MKLSGNQIVDVSAEDARELRAYAIGILRGYMNPTRRPSELLTEFQKNNPKQPAMSGLVDFMSMVASHSPMHPKTRLRSTWSHSRAFWPTLRVCQPRTQSVLFLSRSRLCTRRCGRFLARSGRIAGSTRSTTIRRRMSLPEPKRCRIYGSGVTIAVKRGNLGRVIEAGHETHVWDLDHSERGDLYATTRPTADDAVKEQSKPVHPRYAFTSGRDLWKRLAEAHAVNGDYYVRKQEFNSLQGACEHFWTLAHTRPNESHYLCECKTDGIVASRVNGRTKVIVVEDAVIPAEVCA